MIRFCFLTVLSVMALNAQSTWPSESWEAATPLTSIMDAGGLNELSGLHWNPVTNRLYVVHGDGRLRVLQLNTATNVFTQIGNRSLPDGPEGITQADYAANEFYTIDENNYEIRKFSHTANFSTVTQLRHWDLLSAPSPMEDTANTGPEGIAFIPDSALSEIGFISQQTGAEYTSIKGMGGLLFVAHQDGGYIWAFDVNPNVNNDFIYVGKYKTNRDESCDLAFDRSSGLLYILHNVGSNFIELTDLTSAIVEGERKFVTESEYFIANPTTDNINIEGFAISEKCPAGNPVSAWLCRDVESGEDDAIREDAIRWFNPFVVDGECAPLSEDEYSTTNYNGFAITPNPATSEITLSFSGIAKLDITIVNTLGQILLEKNDCMSDFRIDISNLPNGTYFVHAEKYQTKCTKILLKHSY